MFTRSLGRLRADRSGVAAIEFAILALPFFVIVLFLIEIALIFTAQVAIENSVRRVSRDIRIGAAQAVEEHELRSRLCSHLAGLYDCNGLSVSLQAFDTYRELSASIAGGPVAATVEKGSPESIMALSVAYRWPVITPFLHQWIADSADGARRISAYAVFRNEPF